MVLYILRPLWQSAIIHKVKTQKKSNKAPRWNKNELKLVVTSPSERKGLFLYSLKSGLGQWLVIWLIKHSGSDSWPLLGPASQGTGSFHALSWNVHFGHSLSWNTVAMKREAACGLCGQKVTSASSLSGSWWLQAQPTSNEWEDLSSSVRVVRDNEMMIVYLSH